MTSRELKIADTLKALRILFRINLWGSAEVYETPWGAVKVARNVYQSNKGGKTFCPLDQNARIIVNSTPAFARMVSWKYAQMAAPQVEQDLLHQRRKMDIRHT